MAGPDFTAEELEQEEWRPVVGWEGFYSVSSLGRVRSDICRYGNCPRIMKSHLSGGYLTLNLTKKPRFQRVRVHVLVARAFLGPCPPGMEVNHKQVLPDQAEMRKNNRADNLEYLTHQGNMDHAVANGLMRRGDDHYSRVKPEFLARGDAIPGGCTRNLFFAATSTRP